MSPARRSRIRRGIGCAAATALLLAGCSAAGPGETADAETSDAASPDPLSDATGTADPDPSAIAAPMLERRLDCGGLDVAFASEQLQKAGLTVGGPGGGEVFSADCLWAAEPHLTATEARDLPGTLSALALTADDVDFAEIKAAALDEAGGRDEVSGVDDSSDGLGFVVDSEDVVRAEVLLPDDDGYVDCSWTQPAPREDLLSTVSTFCDGFRDLVGQARTEAYAARGAADG